MADVLQSSGGWMLKQKDMEKVVKLACTRSDIKNPKDLEVEAAAYRIRATMLHSKNCKLGM